MPRYLCTLIFFKYSSVQTYGKCVSSNSFSISLMLSLISQMLIMLNSSQFIQGIKSTSNNIIYFIIRSYRKNLMQIGIKPLRKRFLLYSYLICYAIWYHRLGVQGSNLTPQCFTVQLHHTYFFPHIHSQALNTGSLIQSTDHILNIDTTSSFFVF